MFVDYTREWLESSSKPPSKQNSMHDPIMALIEQSRGDFGEKPRHFVKV